MSDRIIGDILYLIHLLSAGVLQGNLHRPSKPDFIAVLQLAAGERPGRPRTRQCIHYALPTPDLVGSFTM